MRVIQPITTLSSRAKVVSLSGGIATGLAVGVGSHFVLPSTEGKERLAKRGISAPSDLEARATIAPIFMFGAAAVGAGIGKRSGSAALTTASLGAAAMLASPASGALENASSPGVGTNLSGMGILGGVAGIGFGLGAIERVNLNVAKFVGLATMGFAAGVLMPDTAQYVAGLPGNLARGFEHRDA